MEFLDAVKNRRSYYGFTDEQPVSKDEINKLVEEAVLHVPSAFNSQSGRIVVLYGDHHNTLWELVLEKIKAISPNEEAFTKSRDKINGAFKSGYGTLLFFEDQDVVEGLMKSYPLYAQNFPVWSVQSNAMLQFTLWTGLEEKGLGASLQHYNELIEDDLKEKFNIPKSWTLYAQMPFGKPAAQAGPKEFSDLSSRIKVFN